MTLHRKLHIGMSLAPTWLSGAAWRRADSGIEGLNSIAYSLDIAQRAEAAKLDFVFCPDTMFLNMKMLGSGGGFASVDPTLLMASIAHATSHIGLLTTVSTTFFPPYILARQMMSLHWLSKGRAGWNIVTALGGHENFGLDQMPPAEERYARAAEFTALVRALWDSFPADARVMDRATGLQTDPSRVHPVDHRGEFFNVKGPLNLPAWPGGRIPLIQAGASDIGRSFAAGVADAIFASTPDREAAQELRADLRARATDQGRAADDIRLLPGLSLYLAPTRAEARDLFMATHADASRARQFAMIREMTGLDLTDWPEDRPVTLADLPPPPAKLRSRTHAGLLRRLIAREALTPAELVRRPEAMGSAHWQIIGTPEDAADEIAAWHAAGAVDGFIAVPGGSTGSLHLVMEALVPILAERGLFRRDYSSTSFIGHLTGQAG